MTLPVRPPAPAAPALRRTLVLVASPHAGRAKRGLPRALAAIARRGLVVRETIPISDLERLRPWLALPAEERPLIVAAGGDGTVGAVADALAGSDAVLGILPLGTSNDVARSLDIPLRIEEAVHLLAVGPVSTVDLGRFEAPDAPPRHFVHAASLGLNVAFARVATRASVRKRLGRLTYMVAMGALLRERQAFPCTLYIDGRALALRLIHLSVMNAPVFGGFFGLRLHGSDVDDRRLDVLAIEDVPLVRLVLAALLLVLRRQPRVGGVCVHHARRLRVHVDRPVEVSLDGEITGHVPGDFVLVGEALRVVTGLRFVDVDDPEGLAVGEE
jgi:diacylglycerol kinase (ATP)